MNDDRGSIVIETIGAFIPFMLLMASILSLVNVVSTQARVHHALTQTALAISQYSYVLEVTGVSDVLMNNSRNANRVRDGAHQMQDNVNTVITGIQGLSPGDIVDGGSGAFDLAMDWGESAMNNPMEIVQLFLGAGLHELTSYVATEILFRPLVGRYLTNGDISGNEFLRRAGVIGGINGLNFYSFSLDGSHNSAIINENGQINITVRYEIRHRIGAIPVPATLRVTQTVQTRSWLGGSGRGYW